MTDFKPGELVYYVFNDGETAMCTVKEVNDGEHVGYMAQRRVC